jgi:TP901 family phage tail tape measure protein
MAQYILQTVFSAVNKLSGPMAEMERGATKLNRTLEEKFKGIGDKALNIGVQTGIAGAAMLAPITMMINSAVDFEDKMADIAKTTGLAGNELQRFGKGILDISKTTRSSIDDLLQIGEIGGQLGVASNELLSFVAASDKFNIALGKDYESVEQAITQVGKINNLFKDTRNLNISESITRAGSVINELGAQGAATSQNMNDFILRVGALPDALKPSFTAVSTLAAYLEEVGVNAEIGSSGFTQLMLDASRNMQGFATQMKITKQEALGLLSQNPMAFAQKFAESTKGMAPDKLAVTFKNLSIASGEEIKVIGALSSGTERMAVLQNISNKAFAQGISLSNEAAKKNDTLRAKLEMARNNWQALSITIGTELIPVVSAFLDKTIPVLTTIGKWIGNHQSLTKGIILTVGALGLFVSAVSLVSLTIGAATKMTVLWEAALVAYNFVSGFAAVKTGALTGATLANAAATRGAAFAMNGFGTSIAAALGSVVALGAALFYVNSLMNEWSAKNPLQKEIEKKDRWMNTAPTPIINQLKSKGYSDAQIDSMGRAGFNQMDDLVPANMRSKLDAMPTPTEEETKKLIDGNINKPIAASSTNPKQDTAVNVYVNVDKDGNVNASSKTVSGAVPVNIRQTGGAPLRTA